MWYCVPITTLESLKSNRAHRAARNVDASIENQLLVASQVPVLNVMPRKGMGDAIIIHRIGDFGIQSQIASH